MSELTILLIFLCYFTFMIHGHNKSFHGLPNSLPHLQSNSLTSGTDQSQLTKKIDKNYLDLSSLAFAYVLARHGSRAPIGTYPTDPYPYWDTQFWPDGEGQLTQFGKQQLYAVGQNYRLRYNGFLPVPYNRNDTLVNTNEIDRDFMSAACLLAGLYPPKGAQIWNPFILWQPIPIWEDPFDVSEMVGNPKLCPRFTIEQIKSVTALDKNSGKYAQLLQYISKNTGENITKISQVFNIWDILIMDFQNGYKLPQWTKGIFPGIMDQLSSEAFLATVCGTPEMVRLTGGPVLKNVTRVLNAKVSGDLSPDRKLFIDAIHDVTLRAVLSALGFNKPFVIETSASMVFELHKVYFGYVVQVLYFNSSANLIPNLLTIPFCGTPCPLKTFNKLVDTVAPKNWLAECHNQT